MKETILSKTLVKEINYLVVKNPTTVHKDTSIKEVLQSIVNDLHTRHAYVVDDKGKLLGTIRVNYVIQYLFPTVALLESREIPQVGNFMEFYNAKTAEDIMNANPVFVYQNSTLGELVKLMIEEKINEIPVLDKNKKVIGEVNILEIIMHYLKGEKIFR